MEKKPIKYLSLFSGVGSPEMALRDIGVPVELVGFSEIDTHAIKSYCAIHNVDPEQNLGSIVDIDIKKLPKDIDLITHGSPCFPRGAKVMTDKGLVNIEDIKNGDKVLTHTNKYKTVYMLMEKESSDLYSIKPRNSMPIVATGNHPFYVRKMDKVWDNSIRRYIRTWGVPEWKWLESITTEYYCGTAINTEETLPAWNGVEDNRNNKSQKINKLNSLFTDSRFWYLVGRFIGDGWTNIHFDKKEKKYRYRTTICCSKTELDELVDKIGDIFKYTVVEDRTTYKLQFSNKELTMYLEQFGKGAANKKLTGDVFNLPKEQLLHFLDGVVDSDGCFAQNTYKISSVSEELIIGLGQVVAKCYGVPYSMYKTARPKTCIIEGRTVNQRDTYTLSYMLDGYKEGFVEDGILWTPIREVKKLKSDETMVYNLEVEDDHSYTVNNIIVHNCQDFSVAGLGAGGDVGAETRSSLMWNTVEIVKECKPKVVIWENVKGVLTKTHRHNFDKYIARMEELGYVNYYEVLNSKDYGVPQNRERIFVISVRADVDQGFDFPVKTDLGLRLKDYLEDTVEDKFYINNEKTEQLIENLKGRLDLSKSVIGTCHKDNDLTRCTREKVYNEDGLSPTICATDYKDPKRILTVCEQRTDEGLRFFNGAYVGTLRTIDSCGDKRVLEVSTETNRLIKECDLSGGKWDKINESCRRVYSENGVAPTIPTCQGGNTEPKVLTQFRIRKLTPRECWRLMDFSDTDYEKAAQHCSFTQLYKQAGNSIVRMIMELLFEELLKRGVL